MAEESDGSAAADKVIENEESKARYQSQDKKPWLGKLRPSSPVVRITSNTSMATSAEGPEFSSEDEYSSVTQSESEEDPASNFNPFQADTMQKSKKAEQIVKCCYEN